MAGQVSKYTNFLKRLLPPGKAWELIKENKLIEALSYEICRVDEQINELLVELFPQLTTQYIDDWEALVGIPDECTPDTPQTLDERRQQVLQRLTVIGSLSAEFYEQVGLSYGFDIEVKNYLSFQVGKSQVGTDIVDNSLSNYDNPRDVFQVGQNVVGDQLQVPGWLYYFNVSLPATAATEFKVGLNTVTDRLVTYENQVIECVIKRLKPAHSGVTFTFNN